MFKSIGSALTRKQITYTKKQTQEQALGDVMYAFLREAFKIEPQQGLLRFELGKDSLKIYPANKALTNELMLRRGELTQFLAEHKIKPLEISIR